MQLFAKTNPFSGQAEGQPTVMPVLANRKSREVTLPLPQVTSLDADEPTVEAAGEGTRQGNSSHCERLCKRF